MQLPEAEFVLFPNAFNNIIMNNFSHFPISKMYLYLEKIIKRDKRKTKNREKKSSYGDTNKRRKTIKE